MNIEIVEFYPITQDRKMTKMSGTLHVYLIDWEMDIRGIYVKKNGKKWIIIMPHQKAFDPKTQKIERYPIISFSDPKKYKEIMENIRKLAVTYIEEKIRNE